ncbi:hypothetical protein OG552_32065 [Streptomyces sp. NBC_01476]|uniref:hypothetical protein n=1 Tax=Streptomyces sp. NBC_01476 TaxID=2903881 RepID=UPI002E318B79|nr:hypothetical protein [Streptomyces sp. NBC_01476]
MELFDGELPGPATAEVPIVGYPHLPKIAIESSLRDLGPDEVESVLRYESRHRARTPVIRLLTARLRRFRDGDGAAAPATEG